MDLIAIQSRLARLYTDATASDQLRANEISADLCAAGQRFVAAVPARQVDRFARALIRKRAGEARARLPLTTRILGDRFVPLFFQFAAASKNLGRIRSEAIAFLRFLADKLS